MSVFKKMSSASADSAITDFLIDNNVSEPVLNLALKRELPSLQAIEGDLTQSEMRELVSDQLDPYLNAPTNLQGALMGTGLGALVGGVGIPSMLHQHAAKVPSLNSFAKRTAVGAGLGALAGAGIGFAADRLLRDRELRDAYEAGAMKTSSMARHDVAPGKSGRLLGSERLRRKSKISSYDGSTELMVGGGLGALGAAGGSLYGGRRSVRGINDRALNLINEINKPVAGIQSKLDDAAQRLQYFQGLEQDLGRDLSSLESRRIIPTSKRALKKFKPLGSNDMQRMVELSDSINAARGQSDAFRGQTDALRKEMDQFGDVKTRSAAIADEADLVARKAARNWRIGGGLGVAAGLGALGLGLHRFANNDPYGSLKTSSDNSTELMVGGGLGALGAAGGALTKSVMDISRVNSEADSRIAKLLTLENAPIRRMEVQEFNPLRFDPMRIKSPLPAGSANYTLNLKKRQILDEAQTAARRIARNGLIAGGLGTAAGLGVLGLGMHQFAKNNKLVTE